MFKHFPKNTHWKLNNLLGYALILSFVNCLPGSSCRQLTVKISKKKRIDKIPSLGTMESRRAAAMTKSKIPKSSTKREKKKQFVNHSGFQVTIKEWVNDTAPKVGEWYQGNFKPTNHCTSMFIENVLSFLQPFFRQGIERSSRHNIKHKKIITTKLRNIIS